MTIILEGMRGSLCSRRALLALEEVGVPFEFKLVSLMTGDNKKPEYLQPFHKLPFLIDGDYHLYESRAIAKYVAAAYDKTHLLLPTDPKHLGLVEQWISVEQSELPIGDLAFELLFGTFHGRPTNAENVKVKTEHLHKVLGVADKHLATHKYFAGEHYTVADIVWTPTVALLLHKVPGYSAALEGHPHVKRWFEEVTARPAWKAVNAHSEF